MSILPFHKIVLSPAAGPGASAERTARSGPLRGSDDAGLFSRILDGLAAEQPGASPGEVAWDQSLDRAKLMQLVHWMNIGMTSSLLRTIGGDGSDVSFRWKFDGPLLQPAVSGATVEESAVGRSVPSSPGKVASAPGERYEAVIRKAAAVHDVDPTLIRGVIQTESAFNASARSPKGAMGLMQLMPGTARELGVVNPYDPEENIMAGTRYLKKLLRRYDGDVPLALAAYNWGMGNLENHPGRMPRETRDYVRRVTALYGGKGRNTS
ncbi:MAG: lytic transglycosylase domain-containing protein [Syntrophales bacterium]|nr:lytic transglycosylase domain-containing protein [Syntrophales bacterium]